MKDVREEWYDPVKKVSVTFVDVTSAAQALARGHLSGPTAARYLSESLAAVALLGAETSEKDETVILQMKCSGPLGGLCVECTSEGTLRGYTEKKVLDDFDGLKSTPKQILGDTQYQVTRSVPGRILSQGLSSSLDCYLAGSLQRKATIQVEATVTDEVEVLGARGVMIEELPDASNTGVLGRTFKSLNVSARHILKELGLTQAELKKETPLSFKCRCSPDRAIAMLSALSPEEKAELPDTVDITCHMCGRMFSVKIRA